MEYTEMIAFREIADKCANNADNSRRMFSQLTAIGLLLDISWSVTAMFCEFPFSVVLNAGSIILLVLSIAAYNDGKRFARLHMENRQKALDYAAKYEPVP